MSIAAVCPECQNTVTAPEEYRGRKAKCAKCRTVFIVGQAHSSPSVSAAEPRAAVKTQPVPKTVSPSTSGVRPTAAPSQTGAAAKEKIPNPLLLRGQIALCPTLHTKDQFNRFRQTILTPLQEPIAMEPVSTGYKLALGVLAAILILLFCAYLGMIVGLCFLEYYYFTGTFETFTKDLKEPFGPGSGRGAVLLIAAYLAVPVGLAMVIIVLVKPLFFGWGAKDNRFEISREQEPLFFEFVDHLCAFVGAPAPQRIFVDCQVNAAAGLSEGFLGALFGGNRCDLMIGLPLVAGMKTSEIAGILAHEFGHFTQSGARRVSYIVRTILNWFAHIYYYRDRMDQWIYAGSQGGHYVNIVFCWIIRVLLWLARRLIWVFMLLGNFAAGYLSRQMEYDADGFEIKLAGSRGFAESTQKLLTLNIANTKTIDDINAMIQEERLPDNYPLLIAANMEIWEDDWKSAVVKIIDESKTGVYDTHPCDKDRIAAAEKAVESGVFHCRQPASLLFRNFLGLCREVSVDFYQNIVGLTWKPETLKNSAPIVDQLRREGESRKAVRRFFLNSYLAYRFLPLNQVAASKNAKEALNRLKQTRETLVHSAGEIHKAVKAFDDADTCRSKGEFYRELVRAGVPLKKAEDGFRFRSLGEANQEIQKHELESARRHLQIVRRDAVVAERLSCARELLAQKEIQNRIEQGDELHRRTETLFPILEKLGSLQNEIESERKRFGLISSIIPLVSHLSDVQANSLLGDFDAQLAHFTSMVFRFKRSFGDLLYPFDHGVARHKLGDYFVPAESELSMGPKECFESVNLLLSRFFSTNTQILGELCAIALTVETALGLAPLPLPPEE